MADLFKAQAKQYFENRPSYPADLFNFIVSKTPQHDLAWDVATGSGQAALSLASYYNLVVATDTSKQQLEYAPFVSNIKYHHTPPVPTMDYLRQNVVQEGTVDLVTVAQGLHWFDLPSFFENVKWALKKPGGILAVWCYTLPELPGLLGSMLRGFYTVSGPYWDDARRMVDRRYTGMYFPFTEVEGAGDDGSAGTGPVEFWAEKEMEVDGMFEYLRSWSAYQTAMKQGVELLSEAVVTEWRRAWAAGGGGRKLKAMDWQGQKLSERMMQIMLLAFATVAFFTGYCIGCFQTMMIIYAAGVVLTALFTVPNWPFFNRHPLQWLDPVELERHPKPQLKNSKKRPAKR